MLEVFTRHMDDLAEQYLNEDGEAVQKSRRVPLGTLFGDDGIPAELAAALKKQIKRWQDDRSIEHPWQALKRLLE